jgi:hypothetical protein
MANDIALNLDLVNNFKMKTYIVFLCNSRKKLYIYTPISHNELLKFKNIDW